MTAVLDKEFIRKSLIDLAMVETEFVSALILEVDANLKKSKKQRLTEIIKEDFELDVFGSFNPDKFPELIPDPRVNFYGFSAKATIAKHYKAAHIHAYPSIYPETFCISQAEAMSAGLLCVTSDIGALPEVSGGYTTIYPFESDNVKHQEIFAEHLTKAICDIKSGNWNPDKQIEYVNKTY